MQYFANEKEVQKVCEAVEEVAMDSNVNADAIERIKLLEMNVRSEARRELEVPKREDGLLLKDTCETIMNIINFNKFDTIEIYHELSKYVLGHTNTFIEYNPVLKRIVLLINSMEHIYNKYLVNV